MILNPSLGWTVIMKTNCKFLKNQKIEQCLPKYRVKILHDHVKSDTTCSPCSNPPKVKIGHNFKNSKSKSIVNILFLFTFKTIKIKNIRVSFQC